MQSILSIPSLYFNKANKNFTLKIVDAKRVSTLKSLAPKKKTNIPGLQRVTHVNLFQI